MDPAVALTFRERTRAAARRLLQAVGEAATYVPADGGALPGPVLAALATDVAEVGDYGVTTATVRTLDVLTYEVPDPQQGDRVTLGDGTTWEVERKSHEDGDITTLIVSQVRGTP